jgi:hypothetical protein
MLSVPWLLKPTAVENYATEWEAALRLGAAGLWLDHTWLAPAMPLAELADRVHKTSDEQPESSHG